ncbi:hypothetical protein [Brevibacillus porteri]|uniref:hypothetical protein n=1 Tax=Brevibacillus porteri TaxID=2126350 RepID=UPI003D25AC85
MFDAREYLLNHVAPIAIEETARQTETLIHNLEQATGRELTEKEKRNLAWLSSMDDETVGVFSGLFKEIATKR